MTMLSLQSAETSEREPERERSSGQGPLIVLLLAGLGAFGYYVYRTIQRTSELERQLAAVSSEAARSAALAQQAAQRAAAAESEARSAAAGRLVAEAQTADAVLQADAARQDAGTAREAAAKAQAEADAIRKRAEAEVGRLEAALGQIADTRRTALGLVMNLGSDYLKFEFDKADLGAADRELLSRIAGILMTSRDYTVSVNGHTDDVGSDAYNQKLSQRRAQAVRDYLVQAGLPAEILSVEGHGKALPLVRGTSAPARAKNRRVELGIVNTQIRHARTGAPIAPVPRPH